MTVSDVANRRLLPLFRVSLTYAFLAVVAISVGKRMGFLYILWHRIIMIISDMDSKREDHRAPSCRQSGPCLVEKSCYPACDCRRSVVSVKVKSGCYTHIVLPSEISKDFYFIQYRY